MSGAIGVVDPENRFLRWEDRETVHREQLTHRTIQVLLFDAAGRLLVQRRHPSKRTWPGAWDLSCAGHVEREDYPGGPDGRLDEVYAAAARREVAEELGVDTRLEEIGRFGPRSGVHYEQARLYRGRWDGPIRPQEDEVAEVRWVSSDDLDALAREATVCPGATWFTRYARDRGHWRTEDVVAGACLCGDVTFEVTLPAKWVANCHCGMCRRAHTAAMVTFVGLPRERFRLLSGATTVYRSSETAQRSFCARCGSTLFFEGDRWADEIHVSRASLPDAAPLRPHGHAYFDHGAPWMRWGDDLPRFGGPSGTEPLAG